tara:strand:+ start:13827 stop:15077 length:1251 start_codon:yes stop_codon:yes gene_type:complete
MANLDLKFSNSTTQQLSLPTVDGIQHIPITRGGSTTNIPFERFILADDSTVFIFVLTAFITSGGLLKNQNPKIFHYGFGTLKDAMVSPSADPGLDVWDFQYKIRINNDNSDYSIVEVISGELPPGLSVDSTKTSGDNVDLTGKPSEECFPNNSWADNSSFSNFSAGGFENSHLELLDVVYTDGINGSVIDSPQSTFTVGDALINTSGDSRVVSGVGTYTDENNVVKNKITIPYVDFIKRDGIDSFEAFELPKNEVVENGKLTSKKDANFKGWIKGAGIDAYYKDIKTVYTTTSEIDSQHQKDYTFTLGMRSSEGTSYFAQQEFTIRVLQNHDQVRDQQQHFNDYPLHLLHYNPTEKNYIVEFLLPLIKTNGQVTSIKLEDGTLSFNDTKEIEAYGSLTFLQNADGKRKQNDIELDT